MLANTTTGGHILTLVRGSRWVPLGKYLVPVISGALATLFGLLAIPEPSDAITGIMAGGIVYGLIYGLEGVATDQITQPSLQDALPKIQAIQDDIICQLSRATGPEDAKAKLETVLEASLSQEQEAMVLGFAFNGILNILFYTPDWWPSFDDDYLAGITTTCCGDYTDGDPITPGSVQQCQASHYILDQLAATFQAASDELNSNNLSINPFWNDKSDIYNQIKNDLDIPAKMQERATSYVAFLNAVTEIYYDQFTFTTAQIGDVGFSGLADYMTTNKASLIADLQAAIDQAAAFTSLYGSLTGWIDANVTDVDYQNWMKQSVAALITPTNRDDVMDLLFLQDSDLVGYAFGDCGGGLYTWRFETDVNDWAGDHFEHTTQGYDDNYSIHHIDDTQIITLTSTILAADIKARLGVASLPTEGAIISVYAFSEDFSNRAHRMKIYDTGDSLIEIVDLNVANNQWSYSSASLSGAGEIGKIELETEYLTIFNHGTLYDNFTVKLGL